MGQQRRRERDIERVVYHRLVSMATDPDEELSSAEIRRRLVGEFTEDRVPALRTIQRVVSKTPSRGNDAEAKERHKLLDSPFRWHRITDYGIPWEATDFALEVIRYYKNQVLGQLRQRKGVLKKDGSSLAWEYDFESGKTNWASGAVEEGFPRFPPADQIAWVSRTLEDVSDVWKRGPTARDVFWAWRVHLAMRGVKHLSIVIQMAILKEWSITA